MNLVKLFKFSLYMLIITLLMFFILTLYMYYFSKQPSMEMAYNFIVPISMLVVSLLYSRSVHERGLLRGIEIWTVYFAAVLLMKILFRVPSEISILQNILYLPISILGGVIGVNLKKSLI